jgi:hypothetical protein
MHCRRKPSPNEVGRFSSFGMQAFPAESVSPTFGTLFDILPQLRYFARAADCFAASCGCGKTR